jgi:hypothetical protein
LIGGSLAVGEIPSRQEEKVGAIDSWVSIIEKIIGGGRFVANIGRSQLIKQLDSIRLNLEQFQEAARKNDVSEMRKLLAECKAESEMLEKRLFKTLDSQTSKSLDKTIKRARIAKSSITRKSAPRMSAPSPSQRAIRRTLTAKSAELAKTIDSDNEESRQKLISEIDTAIGRLRGIARSLGNFTV